MGSTYPDAIGTWGNWGVANVAVTRRIFLTGTAATVAAGALATRSAAAAAADAPFQSASAADATLFRPGSSEPPGPGQNSAGLAIFRYRTKYGTVYGHTGNTLGYTQFVAASKDGMRSAVVSVNAQVTPASHPPRFTDLREVYALAVAAALA